MGNSLKLLRRAAGRAHAEEVSAPQLLATVASINAKTVDATTLYTVPAGMTIVVLEVVLRCTAADTVTAPASGSVGIGAEYEDIFAEQSFYGLTAVNKQFTFPNGGAGRTAVAADVIKLEIDVAATGTSQTLAADIYGYEV